MFGYDWPRFHAAVNDLPSALLLVTVLFDLGAWLSKRDSLKSAAVWTLWAGVIGGWIAVLAGLQAEDAIEHGEAIHELMETHETLALTTMGIFTAVLAWKLFRRAKLTGAEEAGLPVRRAEAFDADDSVGARRVDELVAAECDRDVRCSGIGRCEEQQIAGRYLVDLHRFPSMELFTHFTRQREAVLREHILSESAAVEASGIGAAITIRRAAKRERSAGHRVAVDSCASLW